MKQALKWINDALATKGIVNHMTHYRIDAGEIRATDGRITAGTPLALDRSFLVPGRELEALVNRLPEKGLTIEDGANEHEIVLKSGRLRGTIRVLPLTDWDYPGVDTAEWHPLPAKLLEIIRALRPFISDNATQLWAMGIAIDDGWCYATNNIALAGTRCEGVGDMAGILPVWATDFITSRAEGLTHWAWAPEYVAFKWADGSWMRSGLIDGKFHEKAGELIRSAFETEPSMAVTSEFREAVIRVAELADGTGPLCVYADKVEAAAGRMRVEEAVVAEVPEGAECSKWGAAYLLPVIRAASCWQPSNWPKPTPFRGDVISGYVAGRNA